MKVRNLPQRTGTSLISALAAGALTLSACGSGEDASSTGSDQPQITRPAAPTAPATVPGSEPFAAGRDDLIIFAGPALGTSMGGIEFTNGSSYIIPLSVQLKPGAAKPNSRIRINVKQNNAYAMDCQQAASVPLMSNVGQINIRCQGRLGTAADRGRDWTVTLTVQERTANGKTRTIAAVDTTFTVTAPASDTQTPSEGETITRTNRDQQRTVTAELTTAPEWIIAGKPTMLAWQLALESGDGDTARVTIDAVDLNGNPLDSGCTGHTVTSGETASVECRPSLTDARDITLVPTWTFPDGTVIAQDPIGPIRVTW